MALIETIAYRNATNPPRTLRYADVRWARIETDEQKLKRLERRFGEFVRPDTWSPIDVSPGEYLMGEPSSKYEAGHDLAQGDDATFLAAEVAAGRLERVRITFDDAAMAVVSEVVLP